MVKKTGNIFLYFLFLFSFLNIQSSAKLSLQITDLQQNKVTQVEVGVPFLVQVVAQNIDSDGQPDGFDAWDDFAVTLYGNNQAITSINGQVTQIKTLTYVVTPQKKGKFDYPALCLTDKQGNVHVSDKFKVTVGDTVEISQHTNAQPFVLQIDVDQRLVFVGQKVTVLLRFGFQESFQDLKITEVPMQNIHRGFVSQEAQSGEFKIGNQKYESQDFLMELYPEKIGTWVIPSFQASFAPQRSHHFASMFSLVLGGSNVVHSQPRSIEVQSLPESEEFKNVTAIGQFDRVEFALSSNKGAIGEGLVAKMTVIGDGNLEIVKAPLLEMPKGLHYYEGNSSVTREKNGKLKKEFEWIVQAEYTDIFSIPEQQFVYFDLKSHHYKILQSKPVELVISDALKKELIQQQSENSEKKESASLDKKEVEKTLQDQFSVWLNFAMVSGSVTSKMLLWLIQFLIALIVFFMTIIIFRRYFKDLFFFETFKIRMQFLNFCKKKDIHGVYKTFELVMHKYGLEMQGSDLQQCFVDLKMSDETFENWKNFVTMIWEMNFAKERASDQTDLAFSLAKQWFVIILSCCKLQKKKQAMQQIIS
ncbi:BatD family protein [Candidatus Babeliales bacterium]|nr:BatD family protein [Candidatus Babeliales bacterium]